MTDYGHRNCQSLFGYAAKVHERSGGVCQLCDAGAVELGFDLWRQMTVEHLIGKARVDTCARSQRAWPAGSPG